MADARLPIVSASRILLQMSTFYRNYFDSYEVFSIFKRGFRDEFDEDRRVSLTKDLNDELIHQSTILELALRTDGERIDI